MRRNQGDSCFTFTSKQFVCSVTEYDTALIFVDSRCGYILYRYHLSPTYPCAIIHILLL